MNGSREKDVKKAVRYGNAFARFKAIPVRPVISTGILWRRWRTNSRAED